MRSFVTLVALVFAATASLASPSAWTQFRLHNDNNAALSGTLSASWHLSTGGGFSSSPALVNGTLYIGNNSGMLYALDPSSGHIIWTYKVSNPLMSAPIVYGNLVIVGEGNEGSPANSSPSHPIHVGDPPSALIAFDRNSGTRVWLTTLRGTGMPTPAIVAGVLVHHNGSGSVLGIDPASGRVLYVRNVQSIASMSAIVPIGGDEFLTSGVDPNAVWAMHAKDGSIVWKALFSSVASGMGDCPVVADRTRAYCNYVLPPSFATPVQTERAAQFRSFAVDLRNGKKLWDVALDAGQLPKRNEAAIPLLAQGSLFVGSSLANVFRALDPATGQVRWRTPSHGPVKGGIVDVAGTLYFGDLAGYLWAVSASNGHVIGVKNMHTPFNVGSPIVAGQTLIIGSRGGTLQAVPLANIRSAHDS